MLMAYAFHYETPYDKYQQINSTQVVRLANAMGINEDGEIIDSAGLAQFTNKLLKIPPIEYPNWLVDIFNIQIGYTEAKFIYSYPFIGALSGLLCLIFGIGKPFAWFRGFDLCKACDDIFVNKNFVYVDGYGREHGYVGEGRSAMAWLGMVILMLICSQIYGALLLLIIAIDIIFGIISIVISIVLHNVNNKIDKVNQNTDNLKYFKSTENGFYIVRNNHDASETMYFKRYWNSVIVERLMECDLAGRSFQSSDAEETIKYGDEKVHSRYEMNAISQGFATVLNKEKATRTEELRIALNHGVYVTNHNYDGYRISLKYPNTTGTEYGYLIMHNPNNALMMMSIFTRDAKEEDFGVSDWNWWAKLDKNNYKYKNWLTGETTILPEKAKQN